MAGTASVVTTLTGAVSGTTITGTLTQAVVIAGVGIHSQTLSIGTAAEQVTWPGDLTSEGITWVMIRNQDATNYVEIGGLEAMTGFLLKVPKASAVLYCSAAASPTVWAKANTAACLVTFDVIGT